MRFARTRELPHACDGLCHVADRLLNDQQRSARRVVESAALQQRFRIQRDGRNRVVDVVRHTAGHLPERPQPLLLQHGLLRFPQFVVRLLQHRVKLRLMCRERNMFAQVSQEVAFAAGKGPALRTSGNQQAENGALGNQGRSDQRFDPCCAQLLQEAAASGIARASLIDHFTANTERDAARVPWYQHAFGNTAGRRAFVSTQSKPA